MTDQFVDRFIEAVVTGKRLCATAPWGGRFEVLGPGGFMVLSSHNLWPTVMRRVAGLKAHPRTQERFLKVWHRASIGNVRPCDCDQARIFRSAGVLATTARRTSRHHAHILAPA